MSISERKRNIINGLQSLPCLESSTALLLFIYRDQTFHALKLSCPCWATAKALMCSTEANAFPYDKKVLEWSAAMLLKANTSKHVKYLAKEKGTKRILA